MKQYVCIPLAIILLLSVHVWAADSPTEQNVASCDTTCQATAPITVNQGVLDVNFDYTAPVEIIAGVLSQDFSSAWWLTDSCTLSSDYAQAGSNISLLSCSNVPLPEGSEQGWVFWLVAPTATADFGSNEWWSTGIYELMWYQIPEAPANGETPATSYTVDDSIQPSVEELPGLDGGPPRPVGVAVDPHGRVEEFVLNEVVFKPKSQNELNSFLDKYNGTVLRDGTALLTDGVDEPPPGLPESSGWYLIKVNLDLSSLQDLNSNMKALGAEGNVSFSSEDAARLIALAARETSLGISPNFLGKLATVSEHPDRTGGYLDAATWWWLEDGGLSTSVIRAWDYVDYKGKPPCTVYDPVKIAIIDHGFDLDETTGVPIMGKKDFYGDAPEQVDEVDRDHTAGGKNTAEGPAKWWHGQEVWGACCALARNQYGSAGTSGGDFRTVLIRSDLTFFMHGNCIYDALCHRADVINISFGGYCDWLCKKFGGGNYLKEMVEDARDLGVIVVAAAGNDGYDLSDSSNNPVLCKDAGYLWCGENVGPEDPYPCYYGAWDDVCYYRDPAECIPCQFHGALCVGAIDKTGDRRIMSSWASNYGFPAVDIFAPDGILTAITRESVYNDKGLDFLGEDELATSYGTSFSSPFVAGIVALMKRLDNSLDWYEVRDILQRTYNRSYDRTVFPGYIDALWAVMAVDPNQPPTVKITEPQNGGIYDYSSVHFSADVLDPELEALKNSDCHYLSVQRFPTKLSFESDRDGGFISTTTNLSIGTHVITAAASDYFGARAESAPVTIQVVNKPPDVKITYPYNGDTFYTNQNINLRGWAFDWEEGDLVLQWESSIDGYIGAGDDIWWYPKITPGTHTIRAFTIDPMDETIIVSDSIQILIEEPPSTNTPPQATITSPDSGTYCLPETIIVLRGTGYDPEDGVLPGSSLKWYSDIDGYLGEGTYLRTRLSGKDCSFKDHTITLEVTDSDGATSTHSITLHVGTIC